MDGLIEDDAIEVDARGLLCPLPILKAKKALAGIEQGRWLRVWATDEDSVSDFEAFTQSKGHRLLDVTFSNGVFCFLIEKGAA